MSHPEPWSVPDTQVHSQQEGGRWIVLDALDGRTWRVNEASVRLLQAVREGWQPGDPLPRTLTAFLPDAPAREEQERLLERFASQGLVRRGVVPVRPAAPLGPVLTVQGWKDLRLELFRLPPVSGRARSILMRIALWSPWLLAGVAAVAVVLGLRGEADFLRLGWQEYMRAVPRWHSLLVQAGSILFLMMVHELGHAAVLGAAGGRRVPVGLRLYWGVPQAYTDASAIAILPERRLRLAVLLGGVAAELLVWTCLCLWAFRAGAGTPPSILAAVVFGGPISLAFSVIPLVRNDAYFILQELTGITNLMTRAEASAAHLLFPDRVGAPTPAWLAWFGLGHVVTVGSLIALAGVGVGQETGVRTLGAVAGALGAGAYFVRVYRRLEAGVGEAAPDVGADRADTSKESRTGWARA